MATALGELRFNRLVQDKVLNHVDHSGGGICDRDSYDKEKRQALDAWDRRVRQILTDNKADNVVPFPVTA